MNESKCIEALIWHQVSSLKLPLGVGHTVASGTEPAPLAAWGGCTCRTDPGPMPSGTMMLKLDPSTGFFLRCVVCRLQMWEIQKVV